MRLFTRAAAATVAALAAAGTGAYALDTLPGIFDTSFRSLKVQRADNFFAAPVLSLGEQGTLTVTFDRLVEDRDFLRYRLVHCNSDWQPSQLMESEYLDTFNDISIDDYAFSQNTFVHYVNYRIEFPTEDAHPLVSGNYLLQVYDEDDPDAVLLQTRFSIEEPAVEITATADAHTDRGINGEYQQVSMTVDTQRQRVRDPYNDVITVLEQNWSPSMPVTLTHPQRVESGRLVYEHLQPLIFRAGNEYRRFETVRADYPGMSVDSVKYMGRNYHAWLRTDIPARDHSYTYDRTQNGRYMVREYNATDSDLGADYVTVHFTLQMPELTNAAVYLDGEVWQGRFTDANRLRYDRDRQAYTAEVPLKQGSYNYRYVIVGTGGADPYFVDGDKYETHNEYTVKTFIREVGSRYDRLVGTKIVYAFE